MKQEKEAPNLREVNPKLRILEEKYGISTHAFLETIKKAEKGETNWTFPDDSDMELIE